MLNVFRRRSNSEQPQTAPDPIPRSDLDRLESFTAHLEHRQPFAAPNMVDWQLWYDGKLVPMFITGLLDLGEHIGPNVDAACKAEEPAVDRWETGTLYPTWEQTVALAALVDVRVRDLAHPDAEPRHHDHRPLRRRSRMAILSFEPDAVHDATTEHSAPPPGIS
ncbi:hypothetical protein CH267_10475 [Rhodococcus sp. 06-621-2]|nr:hypothetical protein [Rhodococcus sp. 06-621-2]OZC56591.1 hypothetical protein CH267_10475 [Rhodococcus sp. 06-621-2]